MAYAPQTPGHLSIALRSGDEVGRLLDFSIDATGYSWTAEVYSIVTDAVLMTPTVSVVSAEDGQVNLSFSESDTIDLATGTYGLRVMWTAPGSVRRTVLDGMLEVLA